MNLYALCTILLICLFLSLSLGEQLLKFFHFPNGHKCLYWFVAEKDWDDIKFGVDNKVDFYAVSFVKDAQVVHELKNYLQSKHRDKIPNLKKKFEHAC